MTSFSVLIQRIHTYLRYLEYRLRVLQESKFFSDLSDLLLFTCHLLFLPLELFDDIESAAFEDAREVDRRAAVSSTACTGELKEVIDGADGGDVEAGTDARY